MLALEVGNIMLIVNLFAGSLKLTFVWTAGIKRRNAGEFVWANSGKPLNYTNWMPDEIFGSNANDNCVRMYNSSGFQWGDCSCNYISTAVCKW